MNNKNVVIKIIMGEEVEHLFHGLMGRKSVILLDPSKVFPARPSGNTTMEFKT